MLLELSGGAHGWTLSDTWGRLQAEAFASAGSPLIPHVVPQSSYAEAFATALSSYGRHAEAHKTGPHQNST